MPELIDKETKKRNWPGPTRAFSAVHSTLSGSGVDAEKGGRHSAVETIVIIGNGMVGHKFCEKLTAGNGHQKFKVIILGEEQRPAYDRVNLTSFLSGNDPKSLALASTDWYRENHIDLFLGDPAKSIDRENRTVISASGLKIQYDWLVFATGSRPYVPPIEGNTLPGVFVYRTIEDLEAIRNYSRASKRAAVLGGGLLGLEAAKALHDLGLEVFVAERGTGLLARQLDPVGAGVLQRQVEQLGVRVLLQRETQRIEARNEIRRLHFNTGEELAVDMVVISTGIRPRDELAREAGVVCGSKGGIQIDDHLRTSDPRIFAIGECACHSGTIYGLVTPGYQMASALANRFLGGKEKFAGADLSARLKLLGVEVSTLGDYQANGTSVVLQQEGVYRQLIFEQKRLVGAISVGAWPQLPRVQEAVEAHRRIWSWQIERFRRDGNLWKEREVTNVSQWPANAIVCNCMSVKRGTLTAACAQGNTTVEALARCTGASTVCGSCKPLLAQMVGSPIAKVAPKGTRGLIAGSVAALVLVVLLFTLHPWSFANTVQHPPKLEQLWLNLTYRQVTGYTLLGIAACSLVLSLRKRIRKITFGDFGFWRMTHALLGSLALVALVVHTGFRLGNHFNLGLMLNFLGVALLGSLAGAVTALEQRLDGPGARRLRQLWTAAHVVMFWPLPVFVAFHIVSVYYF